jgi:hypothetical protein
MNHEGKEIVSVWNVIKYRKSECSFPTASTGKPWQVLCYFFRLIFFFTSFVAVVMLLPFATTTKWVEEIFVRFCWWAWQWQSWNINNFQWTDSKLVFKKSVNYDRHNSQQSLIWLHHAENTWNLNFSTPSCSFLNYACNR